MMTKRTKLAGIVGLMGLGTAGSACAREVLGTAALAGRWGGYLSLGSSGLGLLLEIVAGQGIVMFSPDQGNARIPATSGRCTDTEVDIEFAKVRARLKVVLDASGALVGTFRQGEERPITFTRIAAGQMPQRPAPAPFGDLQTEVAGARTKHNLPALGAAASWSKAGQAGEREAVSGVLVQGETAPVTSGLKWHIGSITKSMTATLVARLVERGVMDWNATLESLFGTLVPDMDEAYRGKTLAQLMTGQAAMPTNVGMADMLGHISSQESAPARRRIWVRHALKMKPVTGDAAAFVYPNNGFVLAGAAAEMLAGKPYEDLMVQEVFAPLGMTSAGFGAPPVGNPQGHRKAFVGGRLMGIGHDSMSDNAAPMSPAGRAHMSLPDLARFGLAHSLGHQGVGGDYLKPETWRYLHTVPARPSGAPTASTKYALGWIIRPDGTLWHNGSNTFWLSELAFDPNNGRAACAIANVFNADEAVGRVLEAGMHIAKSELDR